MNKYHEILIEEIIEECKKSKFCENVVISHQGNDIVINRAAALTAARLRINCKKRFMYKPDVLHESHARWELQNRLRKFKNK